jgi:hypothetical protein
MKHNLKIIVNQRNRYRCQVLYNNPTRFQLHLVLPAADVITLVATLLPMLYLWDYFTPEGIKVALNPRGN